MRQLANVLVKELLQLKRDPKILPILFIAPVMQLLILGYAVSSDIKHLATVVCDLDRTQESRAFTDKFATSGYFDIHHSADDTFDKVRAFSAGAVDYVTRYVRWDRYALPPNPPRIRKCLLQKSWRTIAHINFLRESRLQKSLAR